MTELDAPLPPALSLIEASPKRAFRAVTEHAALWFEPRSDTLLVSFDNLATLDHPYPRLPWLHRQAGELGYSILGVQSMAKDWFRTLDAPSMLRMLSEQGFFEAFKAITFVGASMGGFGALNFAPLVPRARVLALSPQSTMNRQIAPFEARFPWAVKHSNWVYPAFLDAAAAVPYVNAATIAYDPFVPEDKLHAMRLRGPHVQLVRLSHSTHEAVRVVIKSGALNPMLEEFSREGQLGTEFWRHMRGRRKVRKWGRSFMNRMVASNHPKLTLRAADAMLAQGNYYFAHKARETVLAKHPELGD